MITNLPSEVETAFSLGGAKIYKTSDKDTGRAEWHTACPRCGGKDRFVIREWNEYPHWLVMCRQCAPEWVWLDEMAPSLRRELTPEEKQEYARKRAAADQQRQQEIQRKLQQYTTGELWRELHRRMSEGNREWWRNRGVPDEWQDHLQLGYTPEKKYKHDDVLYVSPAYTIPYLRGKTSITTQYRLVNPVDPGDKYRFENGLPGAFYLTEPYAQLRDQAVICEGAIKAIVTRVYGGLNTETASILAVPAKRSWAGVAEYVKGCGRVWVVLDPDGQRDAVDLAKKIGPETRIVTLPDKIDDLINAPGFEQADLRAAFRSARRAKDC